MKMYRPVFIGFVLFTLFGVLNSHVSGNICTKVKEEFSKISEEDLVPYLPVIDEGLKICSRSLTARQASCCSQDTEMKYLLASEQYVVESVRFKNSKLKLRITEHMGEYQSKVLALAHHTFTSTSLKLTDWYSVPTSHNRVSLNNLLSDIEDFIKLKHVIMKNSVSTFFDSLFPVIFRNVIYRSPAESWTHHYDHCLSNHRQDIQPSVFGKYPDEIAKKLSDGLALARSYLEALNIVTETINTTDNLLFEDECKHAVTRMQYCKHCRGFVDVLPCKGFCLDVMRGCLSKLSEIGPEWNNIITAVEGLVREMSEKSLDEVFKELDVGITDAIMHAMVEAPKFYENVRTLCGMPQETSGAGSETKTPDFTRTPVILSEVTGPLSMDIMRVTLDLVDSKGLYSNLADEICSEPAKFEQDPHSNTCWNGSDISVYLRDAVDMDILSQARSNPEVKVSLVLDQNLRNLKEKMAGVNMILQSHTKKHDRLRPKNYMISDDPKLTAAYDLSGDGQPVGNVNIGGGTTLGDDEDYNLHSGSGSGSDDDVNTQINTGDVGNNYDVVVIPNNPNRNAYEIEQGGRLGPDPPRTRAPPHQRQEGKGSSGTGAVVQSYVTLVISLLIVFFVLEKR